VLTLLLPTACPGLGNKPPFSALHRISYLVFKGEWMDLACTIPGVWALELKLQSQNFGPPDLSVPSSWDYRGELLALVWFFF
jgi:hypothetical protein